MRGTSAPKNASGNYNFYCRQCGVVMEQKDMPIACRWCGNMLIDVGFGISGDNGISKTSVGTYAGRGKTIVNIDKPLRH